jgi:predicted  nucleic acid-binding Zn-ribbon protein
MGDESRRVRHLEGELRRRESEIALLERRLKSSQANERDAEAKSEQLRSDLRDAVDEVAGKESKLRALHKWARQRGAGSGRSSPVEPSSIDEADCALRELAALAAELDLIEESTVGLDCEGRSKALSAALRAAAEARTLNLPQAVVNQNNSDTAAEGSHAKAAVPGETAQGTAALGGRFPAQVEALSRGLEAAQAEMEATKQRFAAKLEQASDEHLRTIAAQARQIRHLEVSLRESTKGKGEKSSLSARIDSTDSGDVSAEGGARERAEEANATKSVSVEIEELTERLRCGANSGLAYLPLR